jgi:hypothetical protein
VRIAHGAQRIPREAGQKRHRLPFAQLMCLHPARCPCCQTQQGPARGLDILANCRPASRWASNPSGRS